MPERNGVTRLAEAYAERARTLAAKGMFEEAEIALSKAAGPDGTIRDPLLYVQCLVKRGQVHKAAELAVKLSHRRGGELDYLHTFVFEHPHQANERQTDQGIRIIPLKFFQQCYSQSL